MLMIVNNVLLTYFSILLIGVPIAFDIVNKLQLVKVYWQCIAKGIHFIILVHLVLNVIANRCLKMNLKII